MKRGRKSLAELSVVAVIPGRQQWLQPDPPAHLTPCRSKGCGQDGSIPPLKCCSKPTAGRSPWVNRPRQSCARRHQNQPQALGSTQPTCTAIVRARC